MDRSYLMPYVEGLAHVHSLLGGGKLALAVMQFGGWLLLYIILVNLIAIWTKDSIARWVAGITSYMIAGFSTLGITLYAITPAMTLFALAYLTVIWPFWVWLGAGIPSFIAPYMFSFS